MDKKFQIMQQKILCLTQELGLDLPILKKGKISKTLTVQQVQIIK